MTALPSLHTRCLPVAGPPGLDSPSSGPAGPKTAPGLGGKENPSVKGASYGWARPPEKELGSGWAVSQEGKS